MRARSTLAYVFQVGVFFAVYFGAARLGLSFDPVNGVATTVWPPTGIALAALLVFGTRLWPGIALGAFLVNLGAGVPFITALGMCVGNTLEALVGAYLLRRVGFRNAIDRLKDVLALVALAALTSTLVSATLGVVSLRLGGVLTDSWLTWRVWWLGDAIGDLLVASLILTCSTVSLRRPWRWPRVAEALTLLAGQAAVSLMVFHHWLVPAPTYLLFPLLISAALRLGQPGAVAAVFITAVIAVWGTALGRGPFSGAAHAEGLLALQSFMAVAGITLLTLGAAVEERRHAVRRREDVLGVVSHDLKNPLTSVIMNTTYLLTKIATDDQDPRTRRQLAIIQQAAAQMDRLIQDLQESTNIDAGNLSIDRSAHEVTVLVEGSIALLAPLASQRQLRLEQAIPPGLPAVLCDRERIQQVFSNLIGNAIKFTPEGGSIVVRATASSGEVRLTVADTGPGIPLEQCARVFDRYWTGNSAVGHGTGLGLFITKGIVEAHAGRIWVESKLGQGTVFVFTLPVC